MPELPHLEIFRRELEENAVGREITRVEVRDEDLLEGVDAEGLAGALGGGTVTEGRRHGKLLFARVEPGPWLRFHFGMSGFLASWDEGEEASEYPKVVFHLDGRRVAFDCRRKLGSIGLVEDPDAHLAEEELGPDALDGLEVEGFLEALHGRRGMLKTALMDQRLMAGVGNELSDEVLFRLRLHPRTKVSDLDEEERREAYRALVAVLEEGIEAGMEMDGLPDGWLLPVREEGADCPRCGTAIQRIEVSGRGSYLCPSCQPEGTA